MSEPDKRRGVAREYLRELFDLQFTTFLTTRMLPLVYGLGIGASAVFTLYLVFLSFRASLAEGLAWLVLGPLLFFTMITALRIALEFVLAVFRIAWYIEQVATHTHVVSQEIPKFGALRTLLFGKGSQKP
ncbi:MAG TPA: DUF4282 domain-containing protein [Verrucomicrobiae bacterium]|nr:DUF4282 domain-containing protein [Verrucomicrobiae bacterium]